MPMTVFNVRALASLVTVTGNAISKRLNQVLAALVNNMEEPQDEELSSAIEEAVNALLDSISDVEGLNSLMLLLLECFVGSSQEIPHNVQVPANCSARSVKRVAWMTLYIVSTGSGNLFL